MTEPTTPGEPGGESPEPRATPPRSFPMAAVAGAVILVGLVGFALYRRSATTPSGQPEPAAAASGEGAEGAAPGEAAAGGTPISAQAPIRLTPEASILAERYRCVCGCNDTLSVCTCRNPKGSEDMKRRLLELVTQGRSPEEIDQAMSEAFGPAALLRNPAPPQTLPSHASAGKVPPPPARK